MSVKLTKKIVDGAAPGSKRYVLWDGSLPGFGVAITPSGTKSFILRYRPRHVGRAAPKRFVSLGRFGTLTVEEARRKAIDLLGAVARGDDPAQDRIRQRARPTLAEIAGAFLSEHVALRRKPSTRAFYADVVRRLIMPAFGDRAVTAVSRNDVAQLHTLLARTPYMANRTVAVLASLYAWTERRGLVPEGFNPARKIALFPEKGRERFLTGEELERLGRTLGKAETVGLPWQADESGEMAKHLPKPRNRLTKTSPFATAAIRLLLLTGCRVGEILNVKWNDVDVERRVLTLPDSKTGRRQVLLSDAAIAILLELPRVGSFVFVGADTGRPLSGLKRPWAAIRKDAGLPGVRLHDLRHSFASVGAAAGLSLPVIGKLLGHKQVSTTARYAHLADHPLREASEMISHRIVLRMSPPGDADDECVSGIATAVRMTTSVAVDPREDEKDAK